ncbi:MAG: hypothetical protein ACPGWM_03640, partial [Flavobacteriales bacterium]
FLLFFWFLLFGYTTDLLASRYGVAHQFLYPEYQGANDFVSFAIFGFALGGFILAFNLYTYILHGYRFPFIATLNNPFLKFSLNNLILPATYLATYLYCSVTFQLYEELVPIKHVIINVLGLFFGMFIFFIISLIYFTRTNKNVGSILGKKDDTSHIQTNLHKKKDWIESEKKASDWKVETYIMNWVKLGLARSSKHYKREILEKVFAQNHVNASLFEIGVLISFIAIGSFREYSFFILPAAASVTLLFTVALMLISALFSWIKGWTFSVFIILFVLINFSFSGLKIFNLHSGAYGMNYDIAKAKYDQDYISSINQNRVQIDKDKAQTIEILENWKANNLEEDGELPKLVIINTSGGGLRSALWTTSSLLTADSISQGELMKHAFLMTGSSGGMIGASYVREIAMRNNMNELEDYPIRYFQDHISRDLLNPVVLATTTNDLFIRYQKFEDGQQTYTKDRAYAFEQQLNKNTEFMLKKRLIDYAKPERDADIPMLVMAPSIVNDGRRLIISAQPVSYLCDNATDKLNNAQPTPEDIEFSRFFEAQNASNLSYLSALRMNATFPYILPVVSLPSEPEMGVMDAGLRDNYGLKTTMQFLYTFKDWINENTAGVVVLQVRDIRKNYVARESGRSLISKFTAPLGSVYGNVTKTQNYNQDQMMRYLGDGFDEHIEIVTFQLQSSTDDPLSLSWHLTSREKNNIMKRVYHHEVQESMDRLINLLKSSK